MSGAACVLLTALFTAGQEDPSAPVFVELALEHEQVYVQQPVHVRVRVGVEQSFLRDSLVQLFPQKLEFPLQVQAAWLQELEGMQILPAEERVQGPRLVVGGDLQFVRPVAAELREGRTFAVVEFDHRFLPLLAGPLDLAAPAVRYAYATSFHEDFFGDRIPDDRVDARQSGSARRIEVLAWPEAGRPTGFGGAVGQYRVRAEAAPGPRTVNEAFEWRLSVAGEGNLLEFAAPSLDQIPGFHVQGMIERRSEGVRCFQYELVWIDESVRSLPALPFDFLDPGPPAAYRRVFTDVFAMGPPRPDPGTTDPRADAAADWSPTPGVDIVHGLRDASENEQTEELSLWQFALAMGFPWLVLLGAVGWRRFRARERPDPLDRRARTAAQRFQRDRRRGELHEAYAEYLAARLRVPRPAVVDPSLGRQLSEAGIAPALAARSARMLEELVASRYGGSLPSNAAESCARLVGELEPVFSEAAESGGSRT